jgi:histidine triad (HIT) family protein
MIKMNCIFCKIINNEIPSYKLYEDDNVLCFLDVSPDSNGHCLIIPKKHYQDIDDIDDITLNQIMIIAKKIKELLEEKLNIDGLTLIQNNGDIQEVKHYHLHLKPYYKEKQQLIDIKDIYEILKEA